MYDEVINNNIEYGVIKGNNIVLYIKVGNGGSIYGFNNKYLEMSLKINKIYNYTVIVASNPIDINDIDEDIKFINNYVENINYIIAFGNSNGGVLLANYSYKYDLIKKVLIVNAPLNINYHKIKFGILYSNITINFLYGTKDPSYRYIELLSKFDNVILNEVKDADHNFSNHNEEFKHSIIKYLLN